MRYIPQIAHPSPLSPHSPPVINKRDQDLYSVSHRHSVSPRTQPAVGQFTETEHLNFYLQ